MVKLIKCKIVNILNYLSISIQQMLKTGKEPISLMTFIAILSVCFIRNLPGIAIAPIEGKLKEMLHTSELEIQLLTTLPNFIIIPFVLISGKLSAYRHKLLLTYISLV